MGNEPWNRNAGKFDVPTSSTPVSRFVEIAAPRRREVIVIDPDLERASLRGVESVSKAVTKGQGRAGGEHKGFVARRLERARLQGVIAVGVSTIVERIAAAIDKLKTDGLGDATHIYLVESDMMALHEVAGREIETWEDRPLHIGQTSQVYSARGKRAVRRHRGGSSGGEGALL